MPRVSFFNFRGASANIKRPQPPISSFQLQTLARISRIGVGAAFLSCTLLYGWDQHDQHKTRTLLQDMKPKGHVMFDASVAVEPEGLDTWEYSQQKSLTKRYGSGSMVYVGGGRKEGFRGIIPTPLWMDNSEERRSDPLDSSSLAHVGIVIQPVDGDKESRPLIVGRQSPKGPLPTLMDAIHQGWQQFIHPQKGKTISEVMRVALQTTIENERPHIHKGSAFDTMVITSLPVPVEFVEEAIQAANKDLDPVVSFVWNNCMTTKAYVLLKLAQRVDQWSESGSRDAPSRQNADSFIIGCYEIIKMDVEARGYGVLNNNQVIKELEKMSSITQRINHQFQPIEYPDSHQATPKPKG